MDTDRRTGSFGPFTPLKNPDIFDVGDLGGLVIASELDGDLGGDGAVFDPPASDANKPLFGGDGASVLELAGFGEPFFTGDELDELGAGLGELCVWKSRFTRPTGFSGCVGTASLAAARFAFSSRILFRRSLRSRFSLFSSSDSDCLAPSVPSMLSLASSRRCSRALATARSACEGGEGTWVCCASFFSKLSTLAF